MNYITLVIQHNVSNKGCSEWAVCVCFMIYNIFTSSCWICFWPLHYIPHILIHTEWETHGNRQQIAFRANRIPLYPINHTNVSRLCFWRSTSISGPKAPALIMLSDRVYPYSKGCPVIPLRDPIPDYPPQLQELENDFIMCLMREAMERVWSLFYQKETHLRFTPTDTKTVVFGNIR